MKRRNAAVVAYGLVGVVLVILLVAWFGSGLRSDGTDERMWERGSGGGGAETQSAMTEAPVLEGIGGTKVGWHAMDRQAVEPDRLPPLQETFTNAQLVRLASDMGAWRAGSRVAFDIPHMGTMLESVIERVEIGLGGNTSYIGRVVGQDSPQRMVVTVGPRNAFAYIGSARGGYEMVGNREYGWLMTSADMDRHVDYSKPDYYVPADSGRGVP